MWIALELLYENGTARPPSGIRLVGELRTTLHKGVKVLSLLQLSHTNGKDIEPLAELWKPEIVGMGNSHMRLSGLEAKGKGRGRRWSAQVWDCELIDRQRAVDYGKPRMITGALPSAYSQISPVGTTNH